MPTRAIPYVKVLVHLACLLPVAFGCYQLVPAQAQIAAQADPVNYITHFTGDWALWLLLVVAWR